MSVTENGSFNSRFLVTDFIISISNFSNQGFPDGKLITVIY